ncbi:MAG: hypothetical protein WED11_04025 [Natronospirillum sp.]
MKTNTQENTESAVNRAASGAHETVDKVAGYTTDAAERLGRRSEELKHQNDRWMETITDYVESNPVTSIGIAVAGGYLISRILSGR